MSTCRPFDISDNLALSAFRIKKGNANSIEQNSKAEIVKKLNFLG